MKRDKLKLKILINIYQNYIEHKLRSAEVIVMSVYDITIHDFSIRFPQNFFLPYEIFLLLYLNLFLKNLAIIYLGKIFQYKLIAIA